MDTVREILQLKGPDLWTVSPDTLVFDALQLMAEKEIDALLVMEGETLKGVLTERDYARKVILEGRSSKEIPVRLIMKDCFYPVYPDYTVQDCMALMSRRHVRHLPVIIETGKVIGVVSAGDIFNSMIYQQRDRIQELEERMTGDDEEGSC